MSYTELASILLIPKENLKTLDLILEHDILDVGKIPFQIFPPVNKVLKLPRTFKLINKRFPTTKYETIENKVTMDSNALKLACKYDVDIIISSVTLKVLANNFSPLFKQSWMIPFTVSNIPSKGETLRKVIIFDDPLPPTSMPVVEKNLFFYQLAVKTQFTNPAVRSRFYYYPGSEDSSNNADEMSDNAQEAENDTLVISKADVRESDKIGIPLQTNYSDVLIQKNQETLPSNESLTSKLLPSDEKSEVELHDASSCSESDSSETSLVIDLQSESDPSSKKKSATPKKASTAQINQQSKSHPEINEPNLLNTILMEQEKLIKKSPKKCSRQLNTLGKKENPRNYARPRGNQNFSYKTWLLKGNERSFRLLVRSSNDTAIVTPNGEVRMFVMAAKPEYQPWFGSECLTQQEMFETWLDLHLRPGCRLFRVRLDAYTGDFMTAEQKDAACIEKETAFQYGEPFHMGECLNSIWAILSSVVDMNLAVGSYMLRHGEKDGICVQVSRSTDGTTFTFNLKELYNGIDTEEIAMRDAAELWTPLDPYMVLPVHRALERPPLTFDPAKKNGDLKRKATLKKKKIEQIKKSS